jgi:hypothetical protein
MSHSGPSGTDLGPDQDGSSTYRSPSASTQAEDAARQTAGTTESVVPPGGARYSCSTPDPDSLPVSMAPIFNDSLRRS